MSRAEVRARSRGGLDPALLVLIGGVCAALHVGKLPPAISALRDSLGMSLVEAGFLLSLVQFAGMVLGIAAGLVADAIGLRRCLLGGLVLLSLASAAGGFASNPALLLVLRTVEGVGFLLAAMPAPGLIRRLVARERLSVMLGWWGTFMPMGTALGLLAGPLVIAHFGWPAWWWALAALSLVAAVWIGRAVPADARRPHDAAQPAARWRSRLARTLADRGPWLVALCFAVYSAQWLSIIGFLPSVYTSAGIGVAATGLFTATASAVNMIGNVAAGRLLQRGVRPHRLLWVAFGAMAAGAAVAFAEVDDAGLPAALRYAGVLLFSSMGGLVPGTLFSLAVTCAPSEDTVSTTVGWMQQWSAIGQFIGPPLVAWAAARAGGWQWTWTLTGGCALVGMLLAARLAAQGRKPTPVAAMRDNAA